MMCAFSNVSAPAGHMNITPPNHEQVVEDCDAALKLDANYVKALNRRATALEALERYQEALRGKKCFISANVGYTLRD